jgi:hypothetical protein
MAIDAVQRARRCFVRDHCANEFTPAKAVESQAPHHRLDLIARHLGSFTTHLMPDLDSEINLHIGLPDGLDLRHQSFIAFGPYAKQLGLAFAVRSRSWGQWTQWWPKGMGTHLGVR